MMKQKAAVHVSWPRLFAEARAQQGRGRLAWLVCIYLLTNGARQKEIPIMRDDRLRRQLPRSRKHMKRGGSSMATFGRGEIKMPADLFEA